VTADGRVAPRRYPNAAPVFEEVRRHDVAGTNVPVRRGLAGTLIPDLHLFRLEECLGRDSRSLGPLDLHSKVFVALRVDRARSSSALLPMTVWASGAASTNVGVEGPLDGEKFGRLHDRQR
jgi:hypothetical protein